MSLIPTILRSMRPSSWMEQQLKLMQQMDALMSTPRPSFHIESWPEHWLTDHSIDPSVKNHKGPFKVQLDLKHFKPQDITVKTVNGEVIVEGRQESNSEDKRFVSRHFVRTYSLPDGHKSEHVVSSLSPDGILTIMAPQESNPEVERVVPIELKEQKVVEEKSKKDS